MINRILFDVILAVLIGAEAGCAIHPNDIIATPRDCPAQPVTMTETRRLQFELGGLTGVGALQSNAVTEVVTMTCAAPAPAMPAFAAANVLVLPPPKVGP